MSALDYLGSHNAWGGDANIKRGLSGDRSQQPERGNGDGQCCITFTVKTAMKAGIDADVTLW